MKRFFLLASMLCLMLFVCGCKDERKEFVMGDKELIRLTSTPRGGVETYEIYTTNIKIYVDGTVKIYASDFVKWLGYGEIPELTLTLSQDKIKEIEELIISEDLYNLREDVGNKDGISGVVKYMTIYSANGTNTTGGICVSNRQFVRAYDRIEAMVREDMYLYTSAIDELQYEGYLLYINRNVEILDRGGNTVLDYEYINDVYTYAEEQDDITKHYTVIEYNKYGEEILHDITYGATKEDVIVLTLHISGSFETNVIISEEISDNKLMIPQESEEMASQLSDKIKENIR